MGETRSQLATGSAKRNRLCNAGDCMMSVESLQRELDVYDTERNILLNRVPLTTKTKKEVATLDKKIVKKDAELLTATRKEDTLDEWDRDITIYLDDKEYHWVTDANTWLRKERDGSWAYVRDSALKTDNIDLKNKDYYELFDAELDKRGWKHSRATYTFNDATLSAGTLNMMSRELWLVPLDDKEPHWIFEYLLTSLGGGLDENIEHIEKVILSKWQHPENYGLPCMIIYGESGGVGKNLFVEQVLATLFGQAQTATIEMKSFIGHFNDIVAGKTIIFIDESVEDKVDENKLKAKLQTPRVLIDKKYVSPFYADNTGLVLISGNNPTGSIRLADEDTDRRYSIIYADMPLKQITAPKLGISEDDAVKWMWTVGQFILSDPDEVSRWLNILIEKYGDVEHVQGLHGSDYERLLSKQKPIWKELCEEVFDTMDVEYIKAQTLYDVYKLWTKRDNPSAGAMGKGKFNSYVERWLQYNCDDKYDAKKQKVHWMVQSVANSEERRTMTYVYKKCILSGALKDNDFAFLRDFNGQKTVMF